VINNANTLLNQFLGSGNQNGNQQGSVNSGQLVGNTINGMLTGKAGLATGAVAGGLVGLLMGGKKPKKIAKSAMKYGGAALVGGLAFKAWQNWQTNKPPAATQNPSLQQPPTAAEFFPDDNADQEELTTLLIKAMVSAAKADGHITPEEKERISEQLRALDISAADRSFLEQELTKPVDIDALARSARTPEQATEIYIASILVIDTDGPAEKGYLTMLAARLGLESALVEHLHASVEQQQNTGTPQVALYA